MSISRRDFLAAAGAAGMAGAFGPAFAARRTQPARSLRILILGGTGFLGPHVVEYAVSRGHTLTLFNRGRTNPQLFPDLEKLYGNRDPERPADPEEEGSPIGLTQLEGREFDAVVDTSSYVPRHTEASVELLAPNIKHYHMVSTISVYADHSTVGADETAPVGTLIDETVEQVTGQTYGPLKALCEQAAERAMPGRVSITRPGLICGPGDPTGRFTYWPMRMHRGGEVLCPGDGQDVTQWIDVRDLSRFIITLIERQTTGIFNSTGPAEPELMRVFVEACREGVGSDATLTWVETPFLREHDVQPFGHLPLWVPRDEEGAQGFFTYSVKRAIAAGLTLSPLRMLAKDTVDWALSLPPERSALSRATLQPDREAEILKAWKER
ncbi:MAG: NAD-dependent epimerase/dehydratase family protein [Phycisphaeraceae bacterium]|nr:NAD-dependent epimerase/dehydratase family protein [Phycisphaeraceae bacterium]